MRYLFLFSLVFLLPACKKKTEGNCPVVCGHNGATVIFTGYTLEELDTVYLRSYRRNGLFDLVRKEILISKTDSLNFPGTSIKSLSPIPIDANFDYEVNIPSTAQTFRISPVYDVEVDTFPCNRQRSCEVFWQSAIVTGGNNAEYRPDAYNAYIVLKR